MVFKLSKIRNEIATESSVLELLEEIFVFVSFRYFRFYIQIRNRSVPLLEGCIKRGEAINAKSKFSLLNRDLVKEIKK